MNGRALLLAGRRDREQRQLGVHGGFLGQVDWELLQTRSLVRFMFPAGLTSKPHQVALDPVCPGD